MIEILNGLESFSRFICRSEICVILCDAEWSGYSHIMIPRLEYLSEILKDVSFGFIDVDNVSENDTIVKLLTVKDVPMTLFFVRGKKIKDVCQVGMLTSLRLSKKIDFCRSKIPKGSLSRS